MSLQYAIHAADPGAHLFHVTATLSTPDPEGQSWTLPAWIPGSYMIREFARHVVRLRALAGGRPLAVEKTDKHSWRCAPSGGAPVTLAYEVYANDLSVRAAHLDTTRGFFNGSSVFLLPAGQRQQPCRVEIFPPDPGRWPAAAGWQLATGLVPARGTRRGGFGAYLAADYDELIDCPVEMGGFDRIRFEAGGVPHELALTGRVARLDRRRLAADLARVCEEQVRLFEPRTRRAPFDRFVFLALATDEGHGGLEHRNSTALRFPRGTLPHLGMKDSTEDYRRLLALASHEYFHAWNVKRIRPAAFVPYDLAAENYTRLLWLFEGFTSYYEGLALVRAGLLTGAQYLDGLATTITTVHQRSSRRKQSLAESSFDAWIKYYRPDENSANSVVSYYQKGSLVAAALDLRIRHGSGGRRSLDDLMRLLWRRHKAAGAGYAGVAEDEVAGAIEQATGLSLVAELREWTEGTADPDFRALLAPFGLQFVEGRALGSPPFALLGLKLGDEGRVSQVFDGGPAQAAGVSAGDQLVAVDGLRAGTGLDRLLTRYQPGETVALLVFRRDELLRFELRLATRPPPQYRIEVQAAATTVARRLCQGWLGARASATA